MALATISKHLRAGQIMSDDLGGADSEEAARVAALTDDALFGELGRAVLEDGHAALGGRPPSLRERIEAARKWYEIEDARLRDRICGHAELRELAEKGPEFRVRMGGVIVDAISALYTNLPLWTIAEMVLRQGIDNFCKSRWTSPPEA